GCGFAGLFVIFSVIEQIQKAVARPLSEWRKERAIEGKIRALDPDEVAVLLPYVESGEARQYISAEATSALRSLIDKGIVTPAGEITGYWTDRLAFDLTAAANKSLRKTAIRDHLRALGSPRSGTT
ncbi:MAG: super-infection exclusion protein B, partial [Terracidiphilus sp.]